MTKQEFLMQLRKSLAGLPQNDIEERVNFYSEMIEDRIEEGLSETDAVSAVGTPGEIAAQIVADIPLVKIARERINPQRQLKAWEIILLILGSPIWLSLVIAVIAVVFSVYVSLWSVIVSLWAVFVTFVGGAVGGIASGIVFIYLDKTPTGIVVIASALILAGLCIFTYFGCKAATKGVLILTKKIALWIKGCFIKSGEES